MNEILYDTNPSRFRLIFAEDGVTLKAVTENITATFAFVLDAQGRLLTLRNERGWDIPGGHLDEEESVTDATHREVLEEACVTIKHVHFYALIKNGDTGMAVFTAVLDEMTDFVHHDNDPTSDRTFMEAGEFMQVYTGGDKKLMRSLLSRLPSISEKRQQ